VPDFNLLLSKLRHKVRQMTIDDFFKKENGVFRIPGVNNDLVVNELTGELRVVDKDPEHYPSLVVLPYDFSKPAPSDMPEELVEFLGIVPPKYRDALLFELTSPLSFERQLFVNYIADDTEGGQANTLNTINEAFGSLYGNYVSWRSFNTSNSAFQYDNAYILDSLVIMVYLSGKPKKLAEFVKSPVITARYSHGMPFNVANRFPVIVNVDNYEYMPEPVLLKDAVIIPIIDTVLGKKDPNVPWVVRGGLFWNDEVRESIVLWLIHNVLLRYLRGERYKYANVFSPYKLADWEKHNAPDIGWSDFVDKFIYTTNNDSAWSVHMTIDDAYRIYLDWSFGQYLPLSPDQFKQAISRHAKDGKVCLYKPAVAKVLESHMEKSDK